MTNHKTYYILVVVVVIPTAKLAAAGPRQGANMRTPKQIETDAKLSVVPRTAAETVTGDDQAVCWGIPYNPTNTTY